jgi:hypothetical protein
MVEFGAELVTRQVVALRTKKSRVRRPALLFTSRITTRRIRPHESVLNVLIGAVSVGLQGVAHMAYRYFLFFLAGIASPYLGLTSISRLINLSLYIATGRKFSGDDVIDLSKKQNIIFVLAVMLGSPAAVLLGFSPLLLLSVFFSCREEYCGQLTLLGFIIGAFIFALAYRRKNYRRS